jgi:hypothetical protein
MRKTQAQFLTNKSMATTVISNPVALDQDFGYAVQVNFSTTGSLTGTFTLQASVDHRSDQAGNVLVVGNWVTLDESSYVISGAGSYLWNVTEAMYPFFRLVYTPAIGDTGTLNAFYQTRGF